MAEFMADPVPEPAQPAGESTQNVFTESAEVSDTGPDSPATADDPSDGAPGSAAARKRRRRGSRGGRSRSRRPATGEGDPDGAGDADVDLVETMVAEGTVPLDTPPLSRKPQIGDTRPARAAAAAPAAKSADAPARKRRRRGGRGRGSATPVEMVTGGPLAETDDETMERRRGRERKGRPVGRYLMVVHKLAGATHVAILEGRVLIEHYVARAADDANQIDGNIYLGRVQNVLPGMEAAFIDIGTPKNAVLYRGDVRYDPD